MAIGVENGVAKVTPAVGVKSIVGEGVVAEFEGRIRVGVLPIGTQDAKINKHNINSVIRCSLLELVESRGWFLFPIV